MPVPPSTETTSPPNDWMGPLLAVLVAQIAMAFLSRLAPTLAPALAVSLQWDVSDIGLLSALMSVGSAVFMFAGLPLVLRAGPVRSLQVGLLVGALGTLLYIVPLAAFAVVGSALIGLGGGPMPSAGSDVLRRYAPAGSQNLVFSIKQAGVPIGGVLAGLLLPWLATEAGLGITFAVCAVLVLLTLAAIQPLQRRLDATRDPLQSIHPRLLFSRPNLQRPLQVLGRAPDLRRIAIVGACFSVGQGAWFIFLISHLVVYRGMSLVAAGAMFALMQVVSTFGRPGLGWVADRLGATRVLRWTCIGSTVATLALAGLSPAWPTWSVWLLVVVAGCTVSSWNGVQIAQTVRFAPVGAVGDAATGATLLIAITSVLAPVLFGLIAAVGGFQLGFVVAALITAAAMVPLAKLP